MKKLAKIAGLLAAGAMLLAAMPAEVYADNPIVQTLYTTDPAPVVIGDRVYVFTGHDEDGASYYDMRDWRCYSSGDMVNWTDHGCPLSLKTFSWAKSDAWAGQVVERNGKYYYYVPVIANQGGNSIGVAVADKPEGPYKDALGHPLCQGYGYIDPTVFIDNDGQAYLYWGNPQLTYCKLNDDMISIKGSIQKVNQDAASFGYYQDRASSYEEGPWFYRRGNLYYMLYSAGGIPEHIAYSTSSSPTGPWTYRGVIMPTEGRSFTNHCGVVDFKGHSYFFYHNGALPGGSGFARSVAVEEFSYNPDGSFPTIKMTDNGPDPVATLNPYRKTEAETICKESGIKTEECSEGTMNIAYIADGDWIKVKNVDFGSGAKSFSARLASPYDGGKIEIRLDGTNGKLVGTLQSKNTGAWQTYATQDCAVSGAEGKHDLYFVFRGSSSYLFNFNWWQFTPVNAQEADPTSAPTKTPTKAPTQTPVPTEAQPTCLPEVPGETAEIPEGWYYIRNVHAGKYLQVECDLAEAGANVLLCDSDRNSGQEWYVFYGEDGTITLKSGRGDFNLDIAYGKDEDGANVGIYHAYGGEAQRFKVKKASDENTYFIATACSGYSRVLDDEKKSNENGANVIQWKYNGNNNQKWIFEPVNAPTATPKPTAPATPKPTATATPKPTSTPTPTKKPHRPVKYSALELDGTCSLIR